MIDSLNVSGAASILMVHENRVLALLASGKLKGAKIGRAWVMKYADVIEYRDAEIKRQTKARRSAFLPQLAA